MKKIKIFLIFCLFISIPAFSGAQNSDEILRIPIPGRIEGRGTYFEVKDSDYLNITLESEKEIEVVLESIPRMISLNIASSTEATTTLTIKGLEPNKKYFKYEDSYKNGVEFKTDESGTFSWQQEITQSHHIWFQEKESTIHIPENCTSTLGTWDEANKICTLNKDVIEPVEITTSSLTLNCEGHKIESTSLQSGYGILISNKKNVTIKNCEIRNFSVGIELLGSTDNFLEENIVSQNYLGIELYLSSDNTLKNNRAENNHYGIHLHLSSNNNLRNNRMENNDFNFSIYVWSGIYSEQIVGEINDVDDSNTVNGKPIYYWVNKHDLTIPTNGGSVILVNCSNITVKGLEIKNNSHGILLINTSSSTITENNLENNLNALVLSFDSNNNQIIANKINKNFFGLEIHKSSDNLVRKNKITNNGSFVFGGYGIFLYVSSKNVLVENDILSNNISESTIGLLLLYSDSNRIYHNNFINNSRQISSDGWPNSFDNGYPSGGNYWSDYKGSDSDGDGIGDTPYCFYGGCDRYPFMRENGWEIVVNQSPMVSNLGQFKSDGITPIIEGGITTELSPDNPYNSLVVFKAVLSDPDNDDVKLEVELKEYNQSFDGQNIIQSDFISSGNIATITRYGLIEGKYKWRARAIDSRGAVSEWMEFGEVGNVDFEVKLVPLYTQVLSPYPSEEETRQWFNEYYANAPTETYSCGSKIYQCGCAITSIVMIARYYGIIEAQGKEVNPGTINEWLRNEPGGYQKGDVNWIAAAKYTNWRIKYERTDNTTNNYTLLDEKLNNNQPVIAKAKSGRGGINRQHFFVIDNKLATTYGVKDPAWYNTKTLNEITDNTNKVRGYENGFDGLRIYKKGEGIAQSAITIALGSPAELLITDPQGRKLGKNANGIEYNEIPNAWYFEDGFDDPLEENTSSQERNKLIQILEPADGQYQLQVIGTREGNYSLISNFYDGKGNVNHQEFRSETAPGYIAQYRLSFDASNSTSSTIEFFDEIPPETEIFFNPDDKELKIKGKDNTTVHPIVVVVENKKEKIYQIKDEVGNTTKLIFEKLKQEGKQIKAELKSIQYNDSEVIDFPKTELNYEWSLCKKTNQIKELEQRIKVKDNFEIKAKYNHQKDETTIKIKEGNKWELERTLPSLVIVKLVTQLGALDFEF
jgi:parallel beta-helix repeat protein